METLYIVSIIILLLALVIVVVFGCLLLWQIRQYFKERTLILANTPTKLSLPMSERISNSNALYDIVRSLIRNEVISVIRNPLFLGKDYNSAKLDDDVKRISENVYKALNVDIFANSDELVTNSEYLMAFIAKESVLQLLEATRTYNNERAIL